MLEEEREEEGHTEEARSTRETVCEARVMMRIVVESALVILLSEAVTISSGFDGRI